METRLIKIVPDVESWPDWSWRQAKENKFAAGAIGLAALAAAPIIAAEALVIGASVATAAVVAGMGMDIYSKEDKIEPRQVKNIGRIRDLDGHPPKLNGVYAFHPDPRRNLIVFPADKFHSSMICEQIASLLAFIRSKVKARHIEIMVSSENGAKLDASVTKEGKDFGVSGHMHSTRHHSAVCNYEDEIIVPYKGDLYWIRYFPEILAMLDDAKKGTVSRSVSVNTSFGLTANIAEVAGIDVNWLGNQRFDVSVTFG